MSSKETPVATDRLGVRWTIGDVSERGWEALRLSIRGAWKVFGPEAAYAVCVNSVPLEAARERVGDVPAPVAWRAVTRADIPAFLSEHLDTRMAEGVGWKFAPLRVFPDRYELALDNDCILWAMPAAIRCWLEDAASERAGEGAEELPFLVFAEDVAFGFGQFADLGPDAPRNSGIRGLPPGFDLEGALRGLLAERAARDGRPALLTSELDEQGMQAAMVHRYGRPLIVTTEEVTICSPFWPHLPELGRCGAHFIGLNARHIPWDYYGRPADACEAEHWERHRPALYERTEPDASISLAPRPALQ